MFLNTVTATGIADAFPANMRSIDVWDMVVIAAILAALVVTKLTILAGRRLHRRWQSFRFL